MHDVLDILDLCMGGKGVSAIFILMFISYTRNSLKRWVFSLRRKIERVSAVLTATGSSFHHRGARTENSLDRAELPPGARSGVAFRRPEEAERRGRAGV